MFRQNPIWVFGVGALILVFLLVLPVSTRDPEIRSGLTSLKTAFSSGKVLTVVAVAFGGLLGSIPLTIRLWRSTLVFEFTDEHLVVTHRLTSQQQRLAWHSIVAIEKLRPAPLSWFAPRQFSQIMLDEGTTVLFSHNLDRYADFVDELRKRVRCRIFNPYAPTLW